MLVFALAAAAAAPHEQIRATARIVRSHRVSKGEWEHSIRKREIVVHESERKVVLRLIEFE